MREYYYIMNERKEMVPVDVTTWKRWFENKEGRIVAYDDFGDVRVSTVALGLDHSNGIGEPQLFETMVFGGPLDDQMERYATFWQAKEGHERMVKRVRQASE